MKIRLLGSRKGRVAQTEDGIEKGRQSFLEEPEGIFEFSKSC